MFTDRADEKKLVEIDNNHISEYYMYPQYMDHNRMKIYDTLKRYIKIYIKIHIRYIKKI